MSQSVISYHSVDGHDEDDDDDRYDESAYLEQQERRDTISSVTPTSPVTTFRPMRRSRASDNDLTQIQATERSSLLGNARHQRSYASMPGTVSGTPGRYSGQFPPSMRRRPSRRGSFSKMLVNALGERRDSLDNSMQASRVSVFQDSRVWYDQFTSTDWVRDSINDAFRVKALRNRKDFKGRLAAWFDGAQGWILVAIIGKTFLYKSRRDMH
jgi:chloride channel 3/4/5